MFDIAVVKFMFTLVIVPLLALIALTCLALFLMWFLRFRCDVCTRWFQRDSEIATCNAGRQALAINHHTCLRRVLLEPEGFEERLVEIAIRIYKEFKRKEERQQWLLTRKAETLQRIQDELQG